VLKTDGALAGYTRGKFLRGAGRSGASAYAPASEFELDLLNVAWLKDDTHALDWNGPTDRTFTSFRDDDLDAPIIDHFERVARRHPNRIAVTDSCTSLSFAELWDGLSGLAETITAETRPGDLIGIVLPVCSMFPVAMLACLAAGRPFVVVDPHYPANWLSQILQDARPALIIGREGTAPGARIIDLTRLPQAARKGWRPTALGVDEPACVVFTSGSTGRPKGIVNSQRSLLQRVAQSINAAHINPGDRFLTLASHSTIVGLRDTITALLAGASVRLLDPQLAGAREMWNVIRAEAITILFAFPALLRSVIPHSGEQVGNALRLVRVGGDTTLWSDIDMLRAWLGPDPAIQLIYAATEAPMMQWFVDASYRGDDPRIPIGYPLPGNRLALIDRHGRNTVPGEVGELVVSSPYVALGLWVDGRVTPCSRLFRTGDLVRQRPDGLLERFGRKDRQVKIRGARVELDGVEAILRRHPLVLDVAALARPEKLVAYLSLREGATAGVLDDLKQFMRAAPAPMRPGRFYLIDTIPRLPSSKLDVRALMDFDQLNAQDEIKVGAIEEVPTRGDCIARTVAELWRKILQVPVGGPDDDFFEVGGDSLKAIAFVLDLERTLGLELPLTQIAETPRFAKLCEALREQRKHRTPHYIPLVTLKRGDSSPPVFIIHGLGGNVSGLFPMARQIAWPGAVIGIQARGFAVGDAPHKTVQAMAAEYLSAVKARQPTGPYYLCGYSSGGLVAFEIAQRLQESEDEVALVGLFDTSMSPLRWSLRSWLSILRWKVARGAFEGLRCFLKSTPLRVLRVQGSAFLASARYRPGFYRGELTLFSPVERPPGVPSPQATWHKHARALSVIGTAGDHWTMFSPSNAASIAASLTHRLTCPTDARV
jgi:acyl-coenzyme A synthetase/AMP-(fatty) acid ligase/thioesterase domain-containing protein/acyl carrier protein